MSRTAVILLGAVGVGKGTQAKKLVEALRVPHISTGDILRSEIQAGTELGLRAKEVMDRGELVGDDVVLGMVKNRLEKDDAVRGAIFDGFPRTIPQAESLGAMLPELGLPDPVVVNIDLPEAEIVKRLSSRRVCVTCGATFSLDVNPEAPSKHHCPAGQANIIQRDDDQPETVRNRLRVYHEKTAPLIDYYRKRSALKTVSGNGRESEVYARILIALDSGVE